MCKISDWNDLIYQYRGITTQGGGNWTSMCSHQPTVKLAVSSLTNISWVKIQHSPQLVDHCTSQVVTIPSPLSRATISLTRRTEKRVGKAGQDLCTVKHRSNVAQPHCTIFSSTRYRQPLLLNDLLTTNTHYFNQNCFLQYDMRKG